MAAPRRFDPDELLNRPGTYVNPQTEVLVVVDDSAHLDAETFDETGDQWVLISDATPVDEHARDELVESFQARYHPGASGAVDSDHDDEDVVDDIEPDPEDPDEL